MVSLGSEQASNLGDVEDQIGYVLCLDHEQAVGITIVSSKFLYFNYARANGGPIKGRTLRIVTEAGQALDQMP